MTIISIVLIIIILELAYLYSVSQRDKKRVEVMSDCVDKIILSYTELVKVVETNTELIGELAKKMMEAKNDTP